MRYSLRNHCSLAVFFSSFSFFLRPLALAACGLESSVSQTAAYMSQVRKDTPTGIPAVSRFASKAPEGGDIACPSIPLYHCCPES